jgi:hypothetical protein
MQLVSILMFLTAIMALLSGIIVLVGASPSSKARAIWFLLAGISIAIWCTAMALFYMAIPGQEETARIYAYAVYIGGIIMMPFIFGYHCWINRLGKIATFIVLAAAFVLIVQFALNPSLLYSSIELSRDGHNSIINSDSWFPYLFFGFGFVVINAYLISLVLQIKKAANKQLKQGLLVSLIGWGFSGILSGIFTIFLPIQGNYAWAWIGPLTVGVVFLMTYLSLLRYRLMVLRSQWLAVVSYAMIAIIAAMAYILLFFIVFTALFNIPNPSTTILVFNVIMVAIVLLLFPVINEIGATVKSMIFVRSVDMVYIVKKINRLANQKIDLRELAEFLADRTHFEYVGFLIDGRLWGSKQVELADNEITAITKMKHSTNYIWLYVDDTLKPVFDRTGLAAAAQMRNGRGQVFGHILIGKPLGEIQFEQRDLTQVESIINLVAAVVSSGEKKVCINVSGQRVCGVPESEAKKISGG